MKVVIFARVSTAMQEYDRQVNELSALALANGWSVEGIFAEKISGAKRNVERTEFMRMVEFVETHQIDKVLVTELSRLGRDTLQVLEVIEMLNGKGISLYIQNYGIETLTKEGEVNPMSQFLITILAEVARMERKTIRERVASGYVNFRNSGGKVGRKKGYRKTEEQMRADYPKEIQLLKKGGKPPEYPSNYPNKRKYTKKIEKIYLTGTQKLKILRFFWYICTAAEQ